MYDTWHRTYPTANTIQETVFKKFTDWLTQFLSNPFWSQDWFTVKFHSLHLVIRTHNHGRIMLYIITLHEQRCHACTINHDASKTYRSFATRVSQLKIWHFLSYCYRKKCLQIHF
jgi:hypothetical protein